MGGKCGNRTEDKAAENHEGADAGRAGRPRGVIEGLYITGREGSDISVDCDTDGYFTVSGRFCQRVFTEEPEEQIVFTKEDSQVKRILLIKRGKSSMYWIVGVSGRLC